MSDYELGTVAFATVRGVENVRVTKNRAGWWTTADPVNHDIYHGPDVVSEVRPLVVLDPDDVEQVKTFRDWLGSLNYYGTIGQLQSSLRQMAQPPKPPEPQGLGAVVRCEYDGSKGTAVFTGAGWTFYGEHLVDHSADWHMFEAVDVLADGVQP